MDQEEEEQQEYPEAYYSPIPKGVVKVEDTSGENNVELQMMYPVAHLPLPRGLVKEEPPFGDAQDVCHGQAQQLMASSPTSNGIINNELEWFTEEHNAFNLDEGQQVSLGPLVAYLPLPRSAIKEEPLEEKGDEQPRQHQGVVSYPPIARGRIKEELPSDINLDNLNVEEHELDLEPPLAHPPLPRGVIKEESFEEKGEEQAQQVIVSYLPIARGRIEEELPSDIILDNFNLEEQQLIPQEGGNLNLVEESTPAPIITATADVSTDDRGSGTEQRKSRRRKKIAIASTPAISPSTGSGDQSARAMSTIGSRTRQLNRGSASMTKDDDGEKDDYTTEDRGNGAQRPKSKKRKITASTADTPSSTVVGDQSARAMSTISSRTRSHHSKPGSGSLVRVDYGEKSKKVNVNKEKGTKEKKQQREHSSLIYDGDSSSSSVETFGHATRPLNHFKCDKCMKPFKSKTSLVQHLKRGCRVDPDFPCSQCDLKVTNKSNLRKHLINIHKVDSSQLDNVSPAAARPQLPFKCDKCERSYKHKNNLKSHKNLECGKIPSFPCNQCGYRARQKSALKRHIEAVHGC